jgi:DNA polymerase-3 subunit beta
MELTFEKGDLLYSLQVLQGVAGGRNTLPILSNVLIHAAGGTIECMATDLEVGIRMKVEGTITEEGAITVSAKKLGDIVKELPVDKPINLATTANDRVEITCGDGVYKIIGLPDEEFPQLPSVEGQALKIGGETLRSVLQKTEFAASTEEVRYFLNGLYFNFLEHQTEVVATDGKRLALARCEPLTSQEEVNGFIVPLKAIREIARTFVDAGEVSISVFENQILFTDGDATLTARLVEGEYPKYEKIIPESTEGRTVVSKEQILSAARRVALLSNPKNYSISLEIDSEQVQVSARTPELGEAHETVPVESSTGSVQIGFDARLLIEALAHIETDSLAIEFSGKLNPVLIKPVSDGDDYVSLIMPMRLDAASE